ncbi:MAG TPA: hypothetical protein VK915_08015 [Gaiellaceae bacterium]|nr:hypothetical protein [Gaiellaceae bacterium]
MSAPEARRPGLAEALVVSAAFGAVALAVFVTYARLPVEELYNVDAAPLARGAGRALVFLNYPTAFAAAAVAVLAAERLRTRFAAAAAAVSVLLCATVAWPGVVTQADLDARPVNALAGAGVLLAVALLALALARGGTGESLPFGPPDVARLVFAAVLVAASLPWIAAEIGFTLDRVPLLGVVFLTGEPAPEPGYPNLIAVHLGHHHGMDGTLLALTALALSRPLQQMRPGVARVVLGVYLALMFAYGLANAVQDFWLEQLVKRGATSLEIPSLIVPEASPAWAALVAAALLIYLAARRVGTVEVPPATKGAA